MKKRDRVFMLPSHGKPPATDLAALILARLADEQPTTKPPDTASGRVLSV